MPSDEKANREIVVSRHSFDFRPGGVCGNSPCTVRRAPTIRTTSSISRYLHRRGSCDRSHTTGVTGDGNRPSHAAADSCASPPRFW